MGIVILLVMLATAGLMVARRLPTLVGLVVLAVLVAVLGGAPWTGANSISDTVLSAGSITLASTMIAVLLGSWLAAVMEDTGIATTLVRKIVELGGERPLWVALGLFVCATLVGMVTGSAPAAILVGLVGIPTMVAVGVPSTVACGVILLGMGAGGTLLQTDWQFFITTTKVPLATVRHFGVLALPIMVVIGLVFVLVETRRRGTVHTWSLAAPPRPGETGDAAAGSAQGRGRTEARWYALLSPLVPVVLALALHLAIITSMFVGVLFALLTTTGPRNWARRGLKTLYRGLEIAGPAILLYVGIGIILAAVQLPTTVDKLKPYASLLEIHNVVLFVVILTVIAPLALYRGPINIHGMGAGIAGVLIASSVYAPQTVLGMMWSYNIVQTSTDPTTSQSAWAAGYAGVRPEQVMVRTLPYAIAMACGGLILTTVAFR
jgi:TRAP-type transport system large permease protein